MLSVRSVKSLTAIAMQLQGLTRVLADFRAQVVAIHEFYQVIMIYWLLIFSKRHFKDLDVIVSA